MNQLKIEMFEIRDPDGHVLWFGQSYEQPDVEHPSPLLKKALPDLPHSDVAAGVAYYRDVLGFKINYQQDDLGVMDRDKVTVLLIARTPEHKGIGSAYFYIRDADALHQELTNKGAKVVGEPVSHPWGLREFEVRTLKATGSSSGRRLSEACHCGRQSGLVGLDQLIPPCVGFIVDDTPRRVCIEPGHGAPHALPIVQGRAIIRTKRLIFELSNTTLMALSPVSPPSLSGRQAAMKSDGM